MCREQLAPADVADLRGALGCARDVREEDCGQDPLRLLLECHVRRLSQKRDDGICHFSASL